jgi:hypothetical protein
MLAVVCALWNSWTIYPLKILVVFFHELSHAVMALLTGGQVHGIELQARRGRGDADERRLAILLASAGCLGIRLRVVGLTSLLYAPLDILSDTVLRRPPERRAGAGGADCIPTVVWGLLWRGVSVVMNQALPAPCRAGRAGPARLTSYGGPRQPAVWMG